MGKDKRMTLKGKLEVCAGEGEVISYRELAAHLGESGRRNLVDELDKINNETCNRWDVLLSAVVVGENGMPDSGFFDKFRGGSWALKRWEGRSRDLDSRAIFREELAAVYESYSAQVWVHVFIDLENTPKDARWNALRWLIARDYSLRGVAFTKQEHKKTREPASLREIGIDFYRVPEIEKGGQEADAAILVEFGRVTHRVTTRDFVCFMSISDRIYKVASEIALRENLRVLRFCDDKTRKWKPKSEGAYCAFDINAPETWDAEMDKLLRKLNSYRGT